MKATFALVSICLLLHLLGGTEVFAWERDNVTLLRLATASFAHYDGFHLAGNVLALGLLGSIVERDRSMVSVILLAVVTIVATMLVLHTMIVDCVTFAGISNVNYALLAFILCASERRQLLCFGLVVIVAVFQVVRIEGSFTLGPVQSVWQLHLLALAIGAGAGWFGRSQWRLLLRRRQAGVSMFRIRRDFIVGKSAG